jgi:hypothetical protein
MLIVRMVRNRSSTEGAVSPRCDGSMEDVWQEFVAYRDVQLEIPPSLREVSSCARLCDHEGALSS